MGNFVNPADFEHMLVRRTKKKPAGNISNMYDFKTMERILAKFAERRGDPIEFELTDAEQELVEEWKELTNSELEVEKARFEKRMKRRNV